MLRLCSLLVLIASPVFAATVTGIPRVVDGDTLVVANTRVRLFGIDAPEAKQSCKTTQGVRWACGQAATAELQRLAGRGVRCTGNEQDRYGRLIAICRAGGRDLNAEMVARGAAFAYRRYALDYVGQEERARRAGLGIWQGEARRPAAVRAATKVQTPPSNCAIKGNISKRGRLYHLPGTGSYAATRINTAKGERWFCTEAAAKAAGWRRAGG
ncbi:thermonuclease family protein [Thioclava nitratireducens]|uniref:thermonuclease family protein n=1 Tax=Thioclava nitratireducens TaxID=1915078 RepID=UPI00247FBFEF|nr:thermonuclease family protein [Thioclava nitratireducens]WGT49668.1 thermonuclease family protein [Thioclava nitratireducens]